MKILVGEKTPYSLIMEYEKGGYWSLKELNKSN